MTTLYEILGVGRQATPAQIEHGYRERLDLLKTNGTSPEEDITRLRALREAYQTLSAPARRQSYDARLKARETVSYEVVEAKPLPWATILLVAAALLGGGLYYHNDHQKKARLAQLELEAAKAKAEAEKAERLAAGEAAALERERQMRIQREDAANRQLAAQARYEGQRIHNEMQNFEREKERQERQAAQERERAAEREQREARARSRDEIARMERALSIPIRRH
jgi:hypothetical protein